MSDLHFDCAPGLRLQAHEQLTRVHQDNLNRRLDRIEEMMERLERRLWLAVYGVAAALLSQVLQSVMIVGP